MKHRQQLADIVLDGMEHQRGHGFTVVQSSVMCPDSVVIFCGANVRERIDALVEREAIENTGADSAAADLLQRVKHGHL